MLPILVGHVSGRIGRYFTQTRVWPVARFSFDSLAPFLRSYVSARLNSQPRLISKEDAPAPTAEVKMVTKALDKYAYNDSKKSVK